MGSGAAILLALLACAQGPGYDECTKIDSYNKVHTISDDAFQNISDHCNLYLVEWDTFDGPVINNDCYEAIEKILPIDSSWLNSANQTAEEALDAVVRGFHFLIFYPLGDNEELLGTNEYYCDSVYQGYFHASKSNILTSRIIKESDYENNTSKLNKSLVRFIIERTDKLKYNASKAHDKEAMAYESGGDIVFGSDLAGKHPLDAALIIVHESRHNNRGFSDGGDHIPCENSENEYVQDGDQSCDESLFGAYGAMISYLDALAKGSGYVTLENGIPILDDIQISYITHNQCEFIKIGVNDPGPEISQIFEDYDCTDVRDQTLDQEMFADLYGQQ